jgi:hypothetical protein
MLVIRKTEDGFHLDGEAPAEHNFADCYVIRALREGYLEFEGLRPHVSDDPYPRDPVVTGDAIVLHLSGGDLRYEVLECPGRYGDRVSHEYRCRLEAGGD